MGEAVGTVLTVSLLVVAFIGTGAYAVLSIADFRAARRGFWATAICFAAIGIVLGFMTTWPLPIRIAICAVFMAAAGGGLIWVLDYLKAREALGIASQDAQPDIEVLAPERGYLLRWDPPARMYIQSVPWEGGHLPPEGGGVLSPPFRLKNLGTPVARNLRLHWKLLLDEKDFLSAIEKPESFRTYKARFDQSSSRFYIGGGQTDTNEWNAFLAQDYTWSMPFLTPEMNNTTFVFSPIPYNIYQLIEIYSCAEISDNPLSRDLITVPLTLTISWEKPSGGKPISFSIRAIIQNMNSGSGGKMKNADDEWVPIPKVIGVIGFEVEPLSP
jgi:hypothetical protein